ncbi:MAG: potassium channel family protein [Flavobacteriaceae bacterium]
MYLIRIISSFLRDREYRQLLGFTQIILSIGTVSYHYIEGWSWIDSLYFSIITLTTIGYGDFSPQTTLGKLFTIAYIIVGVGMILGFINAVFHHYKSEREKTK